MSAAVPSRSTDSSTHGAAFWIALVVGCGLITWGVSLYLDDVPSPDARVDFGIWLVGADLVHDLLVVPLALAVGWATSRWVPGALRAPVQAGLLASAIVVGIAWLPLHQTGAAARNPTIQPLDYRTSTLTVLAAVWLAAGLWAVVRRRRATREAAA